MKKMCKFWKIFFVIYDEKQNILGEKKKPSTLFAMLPNYKNTFNQCHVGFQLQW
jgi:hypothetical protein